MAPARDSTAKPPTVPSESHDWTDPRESDQSSFVPDTLLPLGKPFAPPQTTKRSPTASYAQAMPARGGGSVGNASLLQCHGVLDRSRAHVSANDGTSQLE